MPGVHDDERRDARSRERNKLFEQLMITLVVGAMGSRNRRLLISLLARFGYRRRTQSISDCLAKGRSPSDFLC